MPNIPNSDHPEGFTKLDNRGINEPGISFRATGLWAYVRSKPPGWKICFTQLSEAKTEGRDAIRTALDELIQSRLVIKRPIRNRGQFAGISYDFYDFPLTEKPDTAQPDTAQPDTENPRQVNTKQSITEGLLNTEAASKGDDFEQWLRSRLSDRQDIRNLDRLIAHIINQGESSPEWQNYAAETQNDLSTYESLYEELTHVRRPESENTEDRDSDRGLSEVLKEDPAREHEAALCEVSITLVA